MRTQIGHPDPFRTRYREQLIQAIGTLVRGTLELKDLSKWAHQNSVAETEAEQFSKVIATEMETLHDGNFARFRIRPSEWEKWKRKKLD